MRKTALLFPFLMMACSLGEVSLGEDRDAAVGIGAPTPGPAATSTTSPGAPSSSSSTSVPASPAPAPTADAGPADASTDSPCPAVAGYPGVPFMKYTATAGGFVGVHDYAVPKVPSVRAIAGVLRNTAGSPGLADIDGFFFSNVGYGTFSPSPGSLRLGESAWLVLEETTSALVVGSTYPIRFSFASEGSPRDSFSGAASSGPIYRYPGTGPGACTLSLDGYRDPKATGKHLCMQARFRCTGLVGKDSGETFDIVDGSLSVGE